MELKILRTFVAVAEAGTIAKASERLNSVQSNVTARIKTLEQEVGVALFERRRTGMYLTAAGEHLLPYAHRVLLDEAEALNAVAGFSEGVRLLRMGSMETTLAFRLSQPFARFRKAHPGVSIRLTAGPTDDLVRQVVDRSLDLAFVGGAFDHPDLECRPVFREEMALILPVDVATPEAARHLPVAVFRQGCSYRAFTLRWMRQAGLGPNDVFELGTLDGILGCVAAGIAVTCMPGTVLEQSHLGGSLVAHAIDDAVIDTHAVTNRRAAANGAIEAFLSVL